MRSDQYATVAELQTVAPAFVEMANRMVYATRSTVDRRGRPARGWSTRSGRGVLRLEPWHLRVFPGTYARSGGQVGQTLTWQEGEIV